MTISNRREASLTHAADVDPADEPPSGRPRRIKQDRPRGAVGPRAVLSPEQVVQRGLCLSCALQERWPTRSAARPACCATGAA